MGIEVRNTSAVAARVARHGTASVPDATRLVRRADQCSALLCQLARPKRKRLVLRRMGVPRHIVFLHVEANAKATRTLHMIGVTSIGEETRHYKTTAIDLSAPRATRSCFCPPDLSEEQLLLALASV